MRHNIDATTTVRVRVDANGTPFAITADQLLHVRVTGDYFFTISAPLLDVETLPGSAVAPGFRTDAIVWQGFNPLNRTLGARAVLKPDAAAVILPLTIERHGDITTLVNRTGIDEVVYTADAEVAPLRDYLTTLARAVAKHQPPSAGGALLLSPPESSHVKIVAPLRVTGTIGRTRIAGSVKGRMAVQATGPVRLRVTVGDPSIVAPPGESGRVLLLRAERTVLTLARVRQYRTFLGNPDPTGANDTTYDYVSGTRPTPTAAAAAPRSGSSHAWLVLVGLVAAAGLGVAAWARS